MQLNTYINTHSERGREREHIKVKMQIHFQMTAEGLTIFWRDSNLGHVTRMPRTNVRSPPLKFK